MHRLILLTLITISLILHILINRLGEHIVPLLQTDGSVFIPLVMNQFIPPATSTPSPSPTTTGPTPTRSTTRTLTWTPAKTSTPYRSPTPIPSATITPTSTSTPTDTSTPTNTLTSTYIPFPSITILFPTHTQSITPSASIIPTKVSNLTPTPSNPIRNNLPRIEILALVVLLWLLLAGFLLLLFRRSLGPGE